MYVCVFVSLTVCAYLRDVEREREEETEEEREGERKREAVKRMLPSVRCCDRCSAGALG